MKTVKTFVKICLISLLSVALFACEQQSVRPNSDPDISRPTIKKVRESAYSTEEFSTIVALGSSLEMDLEVPESFSLDGKQYALSAIESVDNKYAQIVYHCDETNDTVMFRQGNRVDPLKLSEMDYDYFSIEQLSINSRMVDTYSIRTGFVLATWKNQNQSYSLALSNPVPSGLLYEALLNFVKNVS